MFTYEITVYEKEQTTSLSVDSLAETYKIDESLDSALLTIPISTRKAAFKRFSPIHVKVYRTETETVYTNEWDYSVEIYWIEQNALGNAYTVSTAVLPDASGYSVGDALRVTDGTLPVVYDYYEVYLTENEVTTEFKQDHWWLIYSTKAEISTLGTTQYYMHTLGLIEVTKWYDKFVQGTLTFTQPLGGSQYTMLEVLERIRNLTPFVKASLLSSTRLFTIDTTLQSILTNITAPQFYLDKKTLREAIIQVLTYAKAIPRWYYNGTSWVLGADFINNRNLPFSVENEIDYQSEADGEYYSQKAEIFHENTIPTEDLDVPTVYSGSITDFISFRNNAVVLGQSDYKLILTNNIFKLINFYALMNIGTTITEVSLNDYIFEKKEYDSKDLDDGQGSQAYSVYWSFNSNEITAFSETFGAFSLTNAINNIISEFTTSVTDGDIVFRVEYIPYIQTSRSEQYREDIDTEFEQIDSMFAEYTSSIINASERINSLFQLTNNIYGQIQRLGVDTVSFTKLHTDIVDYDGSNNGLINLGDYTTDGYFVTKKEFIYYNDYVIGRYEMSKNWNRIAQFVQVNKEFRPYEISLTKSDFTLKRDIIFTPINIELSAFLNTSHSNSNITVKFMKTLVSSVYEDIISGATFRIGSAYAINSNGVYMPISAQAEKNTIKFKLDFVDTKSAGKMVKHVSAFTTTVIKQELVPYTEDDGEIEYAQITLFESLWNFVHTGIKPPTGSITTTQTTLRSIADRYPYYDDDINVVLEIGYNGVSETSAYTTLINDSNHIKDTFADFVVPGINGDNYLALDTYKLYYYSTASGAYDLYGNVVALKNDANYELPIYYISKDRSEILGLEISFPVRINKEEINKFVIGDYLIVNNCLIKKRSSVKTLYYYGSNTPYSKNNTSKIDTTNVISSGLVLGSHSIVIPSAVYLNYDSYAIADVDGNLYLAVNQRDFNGVKTNVSNIYFNFI